MLGLGATDRCHQLTTTDGGEPTGTLEAMSLAMLVLMFFGCSAPAVSSVTVLLTDFKIEPSQAVYQAGSKYRFVLKNYGAVPHEWSITPAGGADHMHALAAVEEAQAAF